MEEYLIRFELKPLPSGANCLRAYKIPQEKGPEDVPKKTLADHILSSIKEVPFVPFASN